MNLKIIPSALFHSRKKEGGGTDPARGYLTVPKRLLAYAHITCGAELCFRSGDLVWLVPSQERRT